MESVFAVVSFCLISLLGSAIWFLFSPSPEQRARGIEYRASRIKKLNKLPENRFVDKFFVGFLILLAMGLIVVVLTTILDLVGA